MFLILFPAAAKADLFSLYINQPATGINKTIGFTSVTDIFDAYEDGRLDTYFTGYTTTDSAFGRLDFRGIGMTLDYTTAPGSTTLQMDIPAIGYSKAFTGATQEIAFDLFKDDLKNNQDDLLKRLLQKTVATTPYDSIAGNPSSLMAQMTDLSFDNPILAAADHAARSGQNGGFVILRPNGGYHEVTGKDGIKRNATTISLPLGYTFKFQNGWALAFDLPLSYIDLDGSVTYAAQVGATVQMPVFGIKNWLMAFSGRVGATASEDSLSGGVLYMGSVTSRYTLDFGKTAVSMINMYARIQDYALDIDGYDIDYGLKNNVFKNGLAIRYAMTDKAAVTVFGYDTRYTGSDLYIDAYDEVGLSFSKSFYKDSFFTGIDFTASYTFGDNYKAYRAGFALLF